MSGDAAILSINAGSSSIKFALFRQGPSDGLAVVLRGKIEDLLGSPRMRVTGSHDQAIAERTWEEQQPYHDVLQDLLDWIDGHLDTATLTAVGHRVVHGGPNRFAPERITIDLLEALDGLCPLAPLHMPSNIAPIRAIARARPDLGQVVCFDTAFHRTMPQVAARYALPREYQDAGIRRYGFHGLSYEFIARQMRKTTPDLAQGRVVVAHLGNGASLCGMRGGFSIDTTMGFTPTEGLVMGTRCGSIDPGVIFHLEQTYGLATTEVMSILNERSGLLGVSGGISSDMRTLEVSDEPFAKDAIELFAYRAARETAALVGSLGGIDGLVFTAGIGERSPLIRRLICERLGWLGVELDSAANEKGATLISGPASAVALHVMPTDEEWMIAFHTRKLMRATLDLGLE